MDDMRVFNQCLQKWIDIEYMNLSRFYVVKNLRQVNLPIRCK